MAEEVFKATKEVVQAREEAADMPEAQEPQQRNAASVTIDMEEDKAEEAESEEADTGGTEVGRAVI